jgi:hypothetical protein
VTGARLRDDNAPPPGKEIWLRIGTLERLAIVRWRRGNVFGVAFDQLLSSRELSELNRQDALAAATKLKPEERLTISDWSSGLAR